jgi:hypothetical protein
VKLPVTFSVDLGDLVAQAVITDDALLDRLRSEFVAAVQTSWQRDLKAALLLADDDPVTDDSLIAQASLAIQGGRHAVRELDERAAQLARVQEDCRALAGRLADVVELCGADHGDLLARDLAEAILRSLDQYLTPRSTAQLPAVTPATPQNAIPTPPRGVPIEDRTYYGEPVDGRTLFTPTQDGAA